MSTIVHYDKDLCLATAGIAFGPWPDLLNIYVIVTHDPIPLEGLQPKSKNSGLSVDMLAI